MTDEDELGKAFSGSDASIQVVEIDVFQGAAAILEQVHQIYTDAEGDTLMKTKMLYLVDLCTNCVYQHYELQGLRLTLLKSVYDLNIDSLKDDPTLN